MKSKLMAAAMAAVLCIFLAACAATEQKSPEAGADRAADQDGADAPYQDFLNAIETNYGESYVEDYPDVTALFQEAVEGCRMADIRISRYSDREMYVKIYVCDVWTGYNDVNALAGRMGERYDALEEDRQALFKGWQLYFHDIDSPSYALILNYCSPNDERNYVMDYREPQALRYDEEAWLEMLRGERAEQADLAAVAARFEASMQEYGESPGCQVTVNYEPETYAARISVQLSGALPPQQEFYHLVQWLLEEYRAVSGEYGELFVLFVGWHDPELSESVSYYYMDLLSDGAYFLNATVEPSELVTMEEWRALLEAQPEETHPVPGSEREEPAPADRLNDPMAGDRAQPLDLEAELEEE